MMNRDNLRMNVLLQNSGYSPPTATAFSAALKADREAQAEQTRIQMDALTARLDQLSGTLLELKVVVVFLIMTVALWACYQQSLVH